MSQRDVERIAAEVIAEGPKALLAKMGIAEVTGCADCPAGVEAEDPLRWYCQHQSGKGPFKGCAPATPPDWCPLRAGPLVVRLKP